jgi:hypothetical protein
MDLETSIPTAIMGIPPFVEYLIVPAFQVPFIFVS